MIKTFDTQHIIVIIIIITVHEIQRLCALTLIVIIMSTFVYRGYETCRSMNTTEDEQTLVKTTAITDFYDQRELRNKIKIEHGLNLLIS